MERLGVIFFFSSQMRINIFRCISKGVYVCVLMFLSTYTRLLNTKEDIMPQDYYFVFEIK